jgi:hypothetical protein
LKCISQLELAQLLGTGVRSGTSSGHGILSMQQPFSRNKQMEAGAEASSAECEFHCICFLLQLHVLQM